MIGMLLGMMGASGGGGGGSAVPLWSATNKASDIILSNGNADAESNNPTGGGIVTSVNGKTSGKWYAEVEVVQVFAGNDNVGAGIFKGTTGMSDYLGSTTNGWGLWDNDTASGLYTSRSFANATPITYASGTASTLTRRICIAFDRDTGKLWLADDFANGTTRVWRGGGDPAPGTTPTYTVTTGTDTFYLAGCPRRGNATTPSDRNKLRLIEQSAFRYVLPSGFSAWD
jgi:hypothetical protein